MNKLTVLSRRQKFDAHHSGRFVKDVLHEGVWVHPATKKEVVFDHARLDRLAEETARYIAAGNKVPFPDGHTTSALANLGEWPGPVFTHGPELLFVVEPKDKTALQKIRDGALDAVSVCIDFDITDSKGNHYPEVITHICATDYPVITEQREFVELSKAAPGMADVHVPLELAMGDVMKNGEFVGGFDGCVKHMTSMQGLSEDNARKLCAFIGRQAGKLSTVPNSVTEPHVGRTKMDLTKLALALGLPKDTAPEKVLEAAESKAAGADAEKKAAVAAVETQLAAAAKEHGLELAGGKFVKGEAKPQTALEKQLMEKIASLEADDAKSKIAAAQALAAQFVKDGKVPSAVQEKLQRVLAVSGKLESLSLSSNPHEVTRTAIDLSSELSAIFQAIPSLTKEKLSQLVPADIEEAKKESEKLSKTVNEIVSRNQPAGAK